MSEERWPYKAGEMIALMDIGPIDRKHVVAHAVLKMERIGTGRLAWLVFTECGKRFHYHEVQIARRRTACRRCASSMERRIGSGAT